jgi:hypothetical protein
MKDLVFVPCFRRNYAKIKMLYFPSEIGMFYFLLLFIDILFIIIIILVLLVLLLVLVLVLVLVLKSLSF